MGLGDLLRASGLHATLRRELPQSTDAISLPASEDMKKSPWRIICRWLPGLGNAQSILTNTTT